MQGEGSIGKQFPPGHQHGSGEGAGWNPADHATLLWMFEAYGWQVVASGLLDQSLWDGMFDKQPERFFSKLYF